MPGLDATLQGDGPRAGPRSASCSFGVRTRQDSAMRARGPCTSGNGTAFERPARRPGKGGKRLSMQGRLFVTTPPDGQVATRTLRGSLMSAEVGYLEVLSLQGGRGGTVALSLCFNSLSYSAFQCRFCNPDPGPPRPSSSASLRTAFLRVQTTLSPRIGSIFVTTCEHVRTFVESRWTQKRLSRSCISLRKHRRMRCEPEVARILAGSDPPIEIAEGPRLFEASVASLRTLGTIFKPCRRPVEGKLQRVLPFEMQNNAGKKFTPTRSFLCLLVL